MGEHLGDIEGVVGSIPTAPTIYPFIHIRYHSSLTARPLQIKGLNSTYGFFYSSLFVYNQKNCGYILGVQAICSPMDVPTMTLRTCLKSF